MNFIQVIEAKYHGLAGMVKCPHCDGRGWEIVRTGEEDYEKDICGLCWGEKEITRQEFVKRGYDTRLTEATHISNKFGKQLRELLNTVPTTDFASDDFVVDMSYGQTVKALIDALGEPDWKSPDYGDDEPYWYLSNDRMVVTVDSYMSRRPNARLKAKITAEYDPNGMKYTDVLEARHLGGMKLSDFKIGDTILITTKSQQGTERRIGKIRQTNSDSDVIDAGFTYAGVHHPDYLPTGQGHISPHKIGTRPFGVIHVQVVARGNKFSEDLSEARYHNNHPIVIAVKKTIDNKADAHWMDDHWKVSYEELPEVVDAFTVIYGKPQFYSDESWMWIIKDRDVLRQEEVEYTLDIRRHDQKFPDEWSVDLIGGKQ